MSNKDLSLKFNTNCAFKKWSIGIDSSGNVVIEFNRHPNYGLITLGDTSVDDLKNLGEMFLSAANLK